MLDGKRQIRFGMKLSQKYFEKFEVMLNIWCFVIRLGMSFGLGMRGKEGAGEQHNEGNLVEKL